MFIHNGKPPPSIEPPYQPEPPSNIGTLADAFSSILRWCWSSPTGRPVSIPTAMNKFTALSSVLNPELLGGKSYREIGLCLGTSKAAVSKNAIDFQDHFAVHFRRSKRQETREVFRRAHAHTTTP